MGSSNSENLDLMDRVPVPLVEWETGPEDGVILCIPKFRQRHLAKWFLPLLAKPALRVHLDRNGSTVWKLMDGSNSVEEICHRVCNEYGGDEADWANRVIRFILRLEKERFISLKSPDKK